MGKEEARSPDRQVLSSPSEALEVDPTPPRQESMIQVGCRQDQPGGEGMQLLEENCDEYGIYNLAISANICVLC